MKKTIIFAVVAVLLAVIVSASAALADWSGYNRKARIFIGTTRQWCEQKPGLSVEWCMANGYAPYINDKITMKWNEAWDTCNAGGNCVGAWTNNEWNGKFPGGSGQVWHYKIVWVGPELQNSSYWREGGYPIWGSYEVLMDQGFDPNIGPGHLWFAKATPNGYGN